MKITIRSLPAFSAAFTALQRKAKRLGVAIPAFTVTASRMEQVKVHTYTGDGYPSTSRTVTAEVHDLEITGAEEQVMVKGWSFLARLTPQGDANIILGGGEEVPARFRTAPIECEHCSTNRRRADTFLLRSEAGQVKQVGRSCLRHFTTADTAENLAKVFEHFATLSEFLKDYRDREERTHEGCAVPAYSLTTAVALALKADGGQYVSRSRAEERGIRSTKDGAWELLHTGIRPTEEEEETADAFIAEALAIPDDGGDYIHNLLTVVRSGYVTSKTFGVGVSLIAAVNRARSQAVKAKQASASNHVGTVGERKEFEGVVTNRFGYSTQFGYTEKVLLLTAEGNVLAANNLPGQIGDTVRLKATVKEHSEFRGVRQTVLARPHGSTVTARAEQVA